MYSLGTWASFHVHIGPLVCLYSWLPVQLWWAELDAFYLQIAVCVGLGMSAAVDILIASILIYYLYKAKTGFKSTDRLIHSLMAYTVNSGFITMYVQTSERTRCSVVVCSSTVFSGFAQRCLSLRSSSYLKAWSSRGWCRCPASVRFTEHLRHWNIQSLTDFRSLCQLFPRHAQCSRTSAQEGQHTHHSTWADWCFYHRCYEQGMCQLHLPTLLRS